MTPIDWLLLFLCSTCIGILAFTITIFSTRINLIYNKVNQLNKISKPSHPMPKRLSGHIIMHHQGKSLKMKADFERN